MKNKRSWGKPLSSFDFDTSFVKALTTEYGDEFLSSINLDRLRELRMILSRYAYCGGALINYDNEPHQKIKPFLLEVVTRNFNQHQIEILVLFLTGLIYLESCQIAYQAK